jgi:hypothetical protein
LPGLNIVNAQIDFSNYQIKNDLSLTQKEAEKTDFKVKELEKKLADQKSLIETMQRKAEQGSMQMQGEVQELALEEYSDILTYVKNKRLETMAKSSGDEIKTELGYIREGASKNLSHIPTLETRIVSFPRQYQLALGYRMNILGFGYFECIVFYKHLFVGILSYRELLELFQSFP